MRPRQARPTTSTASAAARSRSAGRGAPAADRDASTRARGRRPSFRSNRRRGPRRRSSRQRDYRSACRRCRWPFLVDVVSGTVGVVPSASLRLGPAGRGPCAAASQTCLLVCVALLCPALTCLSTSGGNAARRAAVFQALDHLGLGREERLEQLARLPRAAPSSGRPPGAPGRASGSRRAASANAGRPAGGCCCCGAARRTAPRPSRDIPDPGMPGMPPNCAAAGQTGNAASTSTNGRARLSVMMSSPGLTDHPIRPWSILLPRY